MYEASFRLRGKTYDYKIQYDHIKKFMLLPKPDDMHTLITIGLDPPLRQGQTRYPFLVMQFKREEEVSIELNMTEYALRSKKLHSAVLIGIQRFTGRQVQRQATTTIRSATTLCHLTSLSWLGWKEGCHSIKRFHQV